MSPVTVCRPVNRAKGRKARIVNLDPRITADHALRLRMATSRLSRRLPSVCVRRYRSRRVTHFSILMCGSGARTEPLRRPVGTDQRCTDGRRLTASVAVSDGDRHSRRLLANRTRPSLRRDRPLSVPLSDALRPAIMQCSAWAEVRRPDTAQTKRLTAGVCWTRHSLSMADSHQSPGSPFRVCSPRSAK